MRRASRERSQHPLGRGRVSHDWHERHDALGLRAPWLVVVLAAACWATVGNAQARSDSASTRGRHRDASALRADSTYATRSLQQAIADVATQGKEAPAELMAYRATVESEIALIVRTAKSDERGRSDEANAANERAMQVEQVESSLRWERSGSVEQHVTGYRSRAVTANVSTISYFHRPWLVPVLYGNRLRVLFGHDSVVQLHAPESDVSTTEQGKSKVLLAVHPFAADRERYYRFSGGDTIAVLHLQTRSIPVMRIMVEPVSNAPQRTLVFRGEIDLDASRMQIVRMKGQFVVLSSRPSLARKIIAASWQTIAFAELINGEYNGRFWLPTEQRIEGQARTALAGEFSPIVRVVSHFRAYAFNGDWTQTHGETATVADAGRLSFAPRDSLSAFVDWSQEIGVATSAVHANDFDEVAPDSWRSQGAPRLTWRAERINDVVRFNRVEGAFTGAAAMFAFRDRVPGMTVGGNLGWAWTEKTARGAAWGRWNRGLWSYNARAERTLANTNDFRPLLDYEQSLMALLATADDYDYVDRRLAVVGASRALPVRGAPVFRIESGVGSDHGEQTRVRFGLVHLDSSFRSNRPVAPGRYVRTLVGLEIHPNVTGEFLEPGVGGGLWYERGDGDLRWQRIEARVAARHTNGPFTYAGRIDAIALVTKQVLPQQLIEFGENEGLPGYAYKEFGGDRAVLSRAAMSYELPMLRAPVRLGRGSGRFAGVLLPSIAPSLAIGVQAGWSEVTSSASRAALAQLGTRRDSLTTLLVPATRPTGGIRSTVNVTLRLFGGTLGLGLARPLDRLSSSQGWHFVLGVGQPF